jgi:phage gp36-like protein
MPYCTKQNMLARPGGERELIQLTDMDGLGVIDDTVLNAAIADADAEINGYLTDYFPLTVIPANLTRIACDITRYRLYREQVTDRVKLDYENAVKYLQLVAMGKIKLAPDVDGAVPEASGDTAEFVSSPSVFGRSNHY